MLDQLIKFIDRFDTWFKSLDMSQHPWDYILHFTGCFLLVITGLATWLGTVIIAIYVEYIQKDHSWYTDIRRAIS